VFGGRVERRRRRRAELAIARCVALLRFERERRPENVLTLQAEDTRTRSGVPTAAQLVLQLVGVARSVPCGFVSPRWNMPRYATGMMHSAVNECGDGV